MDARKRTRFHRTCIHISLYPRGISSLFSQSIPTSISPDPWHLLVTHEMHQTITSVEGQENGGLAQRPITIQFSRIYSRILFSISNFTRLVICYYLFLLYSLYCYRCKRKREAYLTRSIDGILMPSTCNIMPTRIGVFI